MKVSRNWLSTYINLENKTDSDISEALTLIGLEVDDIHQYGFDAQNWDDLLVIGKVLEVSQHPNADKLKLTKVNTGKSENLSIVCGAKNVAVGQTVVVAQVGATIKPFNGQEINIKSSQIRGELSEGMLCAEDEIGLSDNHEGIMVLSDDYQLGSKLKEVYKPYFDTVFEIGITPNRVDAANHIGVARDLSAYFNIPLTKPNFNVATLNTSNQEDLSIQIDDIDACPRYSGIIMKGVTIKESPKWIKDYLLSVGLKPINNIVDITNFIQFEMGQPLHAFNLSAIKGNKIIVKLADKDSKFITLDEKERTLLGTELMICNNTDYMAIAGVFGGLHSGINNTTTDVFIESAYFNPAVIRQTSRKHQLFTDASFRYERGTDPNCTIDALCRAVQLIQEVAGGEIGSKLFDVYPSNINPFTINLSFALIANTIGMEIPTQTIKQILERLEFVIEKENELGLTLLAPTFKPDVTRPIDVVEEIIRIFNLNNITTDDQIRAIIQPNPNEQKVKIKSKIKARLEGLGFYEAFHLSLVDSKAMVLPDEQRVKLLNPLSNEYEYIRDNLYLGGLKSIAYNLNRQQSDIKLYELGSIHKKLGEQYLETYCLGAWLTGNFYPRNWLHQQEQNPIWMVKSILENLLKQSGFSNYIIIETQNPNFEVCYNIESEDNPIGFFGKLFTKVLKTMDIDKSVYYLEMALDEVLTNSNTHKFKFEELNKFPKVWRDLSLVCKKDIVFTDIKAVIQNITGNILEGIQLMDIYSGDKVAHEYESVSIRLFFEDRTKTLEDFVIDEKISLILQKLKQELSIELR